MTQSFDEIYAPKAMSLDELFAAIRPPPLKPVEYDPVAPTRTDQFSLGIPAAPDLVGSYVHGNPFGSGAPNPAGMNQSPSMNAMFSAALNALRPQKIGVRSGPASTTPTTANVNSAGNGVQLRLPDGSLVPDADSPTGSLMSPSADLSSVASAGRLTGENYARLLRNPNSASGAFNYLAGSLGSHLGHGGSLDYQREGNFLTGYTHRPQFAHISNFNVGLFAQQAGLTLDEAHRFAGGYARLFSNNADPSKPYGLNKDQYDFIEAGYKAGASGLYGPAAPSRLQP